MWILTDIIFLVVFAVSVLTTGLFIEHIQCWWFDRRYPCKCAKTNRMEVMEVWMTSKRSDCPRHDWVTLTRFDTVNAISLFLVISTIFVATLELHRLFAWWH